MATDATLKNVPVLIVEDHPPSSDLLLTLLEREGCRAFVAPSAEHALSALETFRPRIIFINLVLPRMSGLLLAQTLRAEPGNLGIALIAITAFSDPQTMRLIREAGCAGHVRKPIDTAAFPAVVLQCLAGGAS